MACPLILATEIDLGWIATIITALGGSGIFKLFHSYWKQREEEKRKGWEAAVNAKDSQLSKERDRNEELSKALSRKSDQHAEKIQELMGVTLAKVEEWSGKSETLLDRALNVQASFGADVKEFTAEVGRLTREVSRVYDLIDSLGVTLRERGIDPEEDEEEDDEEE